MPPVAAGVTLALPLTARLPPQAPDAVQAVALADDQVSVVAAPRVRLLGTALMVTVGSGLTATVAVAFAEPPGPVQVKA